MNEALTFAFAAGIVAAVNPCGFALLPAYLSFFLGLEGREGEPLDRAVPRALKVAVTMTVGFVAVFAVMGLVVTQVSQAVQGHLKWVTIAIGVALVALGVATIARRQVGGLALPKLARGGRDRGLWSMFLFGISYATASLTCTIAPFLAATATTFSNDGIAAGVASFVAYGLGMGLLVTALTLAVALARGSLVAGFRRLVRYVPFVTGTMLVLAGAYVAYYGVYEVRQSRDALTRDPIIDEGFDVSARLQTWVQDVGPVRLGIACAVATGVVVLCVAWRSRHRAAARAGQPSSV